MLTWDHSCVLVWVQGKHVIELFRINTESLILLWISFHWWLNNVTFYIHAGPVNLHWQWLSESKGALNWLNILFVFVVSADESYSGLGPGDFSVLFGVVFFKYSASRCSAIWNLIHYKKPIIILNATLA